jgi:hypothetical protein
MRYHEIAPEHPAIRERPFDIATLFVPRGQVDPSISVCEQHNGRIIQTRVLPEFRGYSVDVLTDNSEIAANLLGNWVSRSDAITATVSNGKSVLDTLSDMIDGEGAR